MNTIAIIEDNQTVREEISSYLQRQGFHTIIPEDFSNIPSVLEESVADLLLLDINLGHFDGYALCREIRRKSQIPIIFVTGRSSDLDELKGLPWEAMTISENPIICLYCWRVYAVCCREAVRYRRLWSSPGLS